MRVVFSRPKVATPNLLAEAEIVFEEYSDGRWPLVGLKLVGFQVRKGDRGNFVTFPARAFGAGRERHYFEYVRPVAETFTEDGARAVNGLKDWLIEEFEKWVGKR